MPIAAIREKSVDISRFSDRAIPGGGLTTSVVAIETDVIQGGKPIVGYGFSSIGRFAQCGLLRDRVIPRLVAAGDRIANDDESNLDRYRVLEIIRFMTSADWPQSAVWSHGGHLFGLHVVAGLGLGGVEVYSSSFAPFGGLADDAVT